MPTEVRELHEGQLIFISLSGTLTTADYDQFVPVLEQAIKHHGKISLVVEMHDFHGWEAAALWEDTKFDFKHFSDFHRIAMIGDRKWEAGMAKFCKPFTTAKVRYFDRKDSQDAIAWAGELLESVRYPPAS